MTTFTTLSPTSSTTEKTEQQKLIVNSPAPTFAIQDVYGNIQKLGDYTGKKILLSFHRNVGCPICNLRFHELEREAEFFKTKGLILISVYESSPDNLRKYLDGIKTHSIMIPDPSQSLYKLYRVERSTGKMLKGFFNGAMKKAKEGSILQDKSIKQDGNLNRIGAEFLINEKGVIVSAYYGSYLGDHMPLSEIKKFASK